MPRHFLVFAFAASVVALHAADPAADSDARLRDALKNTMLQLRTAEVEKTTALAGKAAAEKQNKDLAEQVTKLGKQLAEDKTAADANIAEQRTKIAAQETEIARLNESLAKWKEGHKQVSDLARKANGERANLALKAAVLERTVAMRETQNLELYQTGIDLLDRFQKFGLGEALAAREPFLGLTRVRLQTLVQDYKDKLEDRKLQPANQRVVSKPKL